MKKRVEKEEKGKNEGKRKRKQRGKKEEKGKKKKGRFVKERRKQRELYQMPTVIK